MATFTVALTPTAAPAAPPSNDDFANAQVIAAPGIVTGTNVDATTEVDEPIRHITDDNVDYAPTTSVWYQWTSPDVASPPEMLLSTRGSDFDTILAVYTGGPGLADLTEVVADDDFDVASGPSRLRFQPAQDTVYYFAVDSCCDGNPLATGSIRLRLSEISGQGSIDGFVTSNGSSGVDGFCVIAVDDTGEQVSTTGYTDAAGEYIINSVEAGTDRHLKFWNCNGATTYAGEFNGDAQTLSAAPDIAITNGQTLHINATVQQGGSISGTVSPDDVGSSSSLADICVRATMVGDPDDGFSRQTTTNSGGAYTIVGLDGGDYLVRFGGDCGPNGAFGTEYFDNALDRVDADLVTVTEGAGAGPVNAGLAVAPGTITGTAREWESGPGLPNICVRAVGPSYTSPTFDTDANGNYTIPNVPPGTDHIVRFTDCHTGFDPLTTQWYNRALTDLEADPITVTSGNTTPSIDASMFRAGHVGGHVTDSAGAARAGVCVDVYQSGGSLVRSTTTAVDGGWTVPVAPGNYQVFFHGCAPDPGFQELWWHSRTGQGPAEDVFVDQSDSVTNIDQLLPDDGLITGRVTNGGGNPLPDICVTAYEAGTLDLAAQDETDLYGFFDLGVDAGDYDVQYLDCDDIYREQWFDGELDQASADTITVPTQSTVRASATLARWGTISGTITNEASQPLPGICVTTFDSNGDQLDNEIVSRADGTYTVGGMATGSYRVRYDDCSGSTYGTEFYNNKLDLDSANGVPVDFGLDTNGTDVVLQSEVPANVVLPAITGTAQVGVTLHADPGTWLHDPAAFAYQWYTCDAAGTVCDPANGIGNSYFVGPGDLGKRIRVDVTAENGVGGTTESAPLTDVVGSGPPENDDLADRTLLSGTGPIHVIGTNVDATREPGEPAHGGFTIGASVWYEWTAPSGASAMDLAQLDLSNSDFQPTISVYDGSPAYGSLNLVAEDDLSVGITYSVIWEPVAGRTYYIAIDGYWDYTTSAPSEGSIDLRLSSASGISGTVSDVNGDPIRDICVTAVSDVTGNSTNTRADGTFLMQLDPGNYTVEYTDCAYEFEEQWYDGAVVVEDATLVHVSAETVTPDVDATLTRIAPFGSISGTVTNEQGDLLPNICVTAYGSHGYAGSAYTAPDGTYQIRGLGDPDYPEDRVDYQIEFIDCSGFYGTESYDNKIDGDFDAVWVQLDEQVGGIDVVLQHDAPENTATPTVAGKARVGGTLRARHGTWDHEPSVFSYQWYRCEADTTGCVPADDGDARRYLLTASDEGYRFKVEVIAKNSIGTGTAETAQTAVVDTGAPANDDIADRQELAGPLPIVVTGDNVNATRELGEPDHLGFIDGASVWYEWTAPSSGLPDEVTVNLAGSSFDTTLSIYDGTPTPFSGLNLVAESDEYSDDESTSAATFEPLADTTYYIAVDGYVDDITGDVDMGSIDLRLNAATGVSGTVIDEDLDPIRDICVTATQDPEQLPEGPQIETSADGSYYLELAPGTWYVDFFDCVGQYEEQWYDGVAQFQDATPITVTDGAVTTDVDATMVETAPYGSISGTVVNDDNEPIPDICVLAFDENAISYGLGCTDENGTYQIRGLGDPDNPTVPIAYLVSFQDCGCLYGTEFYDNQIDPDEADLVAVHMDQDVTGIDAKLQSEAPVNTTLPSITGNTGVVGSTLTATNGTWQHEPSLFEYQWQRCNTAGGSCLPIAGAQSQAYVTTIDDETFRLRVVVTAGNSIDYTEATSPASGPIGAPMLVTRPVVTGQLTAGSTLSTTNGTWTSSPTGYAHQWLRCDANTVNCVPIAGADAATYVIVGADTGFTLRSEVTATNDDGSGVGRSYGTTRIDAPSNTVRPAISGQLTVGSTLSATPGTWTGSPTGYAYQWLRCDANTVNCVPITDADDPTYVTVVADDGHSLRVAVTASNANGSNTVQSYGTTRVGAPTNTVRPAISGQLTVGSMLSATTGTWTGSPTGYTYQWLRCDLNTVNCIAIGSGGTGDTYVLTGDDSGHTMRVAVTATNANGSTTTLSYGTNRVDAPWNTDRPVITGQVAVGSTLTASQGAWLGSPNGFAYEWRRCDTDTLNCVAIADADEQTYVVAGADTGHTLRVSVTASHANGNSRALSYGTTVVGAPTITTRPTISGTTAAESTLSATTGSWTESPDTYDFQWLRCDTDTLNCVAIPDADEQDYTATEADAGYTLRVAVTATNANGNATARSYGTGVVSGPPDENVGAYQLQGTCGVLGILGPGFTLQAGPTTPLPVGTTVTITGSGVANIGVFSVSGGTATVDVLSSTSRQITLTSALPAGATIAFRTTLSITIPFTLNGATALPSGYAAIGAKTAGTVSSSLILCSGS